MTRPRALTIFYIEVFTVCAQQQYVIKIEQHPLVMLGLERYSCLFLCIIWSFFLLLHPWSCSEGPGSTTLYSTSALSLGLAWLLSPCEARKKVLIRPLNHEEQTMKKQWFDFPSVFTCSPL